MTDAYRVPPPEEGDQEIVTVASYTTAIEAEMARVFLQDHGIIAFSREAASFNPLLSAIAGGAFVEVCSRDEGRSRALLARLERTPARDDDDSDGDGEVRCPRCELSYCFHETALGNTPASSLQLGQLLAVLLQPFAAFARKRWFCRKCLHVWDDPAEGPARMTSLHEDDPRPVFRLRRRHGGSGLMLGLGLAMLLGLVASQTRAPAPIAIVLVLVPIAGYIIGRRSFHDVCSLPTCRATLPRGADDCPLCRGAIAGVITSASEHHAEAAQFRRELAGLAAADEPKALPAKPAPVKKEQRRAAPSEPRATD